MQKDDRIFVAGHRGLVGRAVIRRLRTENYSNVHTVDKHQLDLLDGEAVREYFLRQKFPHVIIAAARVGGVQFNISNPTKLGYENGMIALNVLDACHRADVERVMFLGSSCIYPRSCPQPMKEEYLLTGPLEPTNEMYALSKILGLKMIEAYRAEFGRRWISCQPCNLYGPFDDFDPTNSHFVAALIRKVHEAKTTRKLQVECWGTGNARRELLYVDDVADAIVFLMKNYDGSFVNVGSGFDHTIREVTEFVAEIVGFDGAIVWQPDKPEGMPRKLLDVSRMNALGWKPRTDLKAGLAKTYKWWLDQGGSDEVLACPQLVG